MKRTLQILLLLVLLAGVIWASCPLSVKCPVDGADCYKVGDDYAGLVHIGIYEHTTVSGTTHRVTARCPN